MLIPLIWVIILCFIFLIIGMAIPRPKPHCSGRLIVDESGETELWSFMLDDPLEDVKEKKIIFLEVDRRT